MRDRRVTDAGAAQAVSKCRVTVVQMTSSHHVTTSLNHLDALICQVEPSSVDAIFLPENFAALASSDVVSIGQSESTYFSKSEGNSPYQPEILPMICALARAKRTWVFAGTMPLAVRPDKTSIEDGRVRAASLVVDPAGNIVARYDKIHLFDVEVSDTTKVYRESSTFEPGDRPAVVTTPFATVGLSVCYDLRFPKHYLDLTKLGATVIAAPSAFTRPTGAAHFEALMRARAIENATFVIAACQSGDHDSGRQTYGHSMVVSPWGEVIDHLENEPGLLTLELDFTELETIRRQIPAWRLQ